METEVIFETEQYISKCNPYVRFWLQSHWHRLCEVTLFLDLQWYQIDFNWSWNELGQHFRDGQLKLNLKVNIRYLD